MTGGGPGRALRATLTPRSPGVVTEALGAADRPLAAATDDPRRVPGDGLSAMLLVAGPRRDWPSRGATDGPATR
jgi:hypothetical protein